MGDTDLISSETKEELLDDVEELLRIIGSIQKTIRNKMNSWYNYEWLKRDRLQIRVFEIRN